MSDMIKCHVLIGHMLLRWYIELTCMEPRMINNKQLINCRDDINDHI